MSFAAVASMASAQYVIGLATSEQLEAAGLSGTKTEIAGGTVIVDNEAGTFGLAYTDSWGTTTCYKSYRNVKVGNSEEIVLGSGAVGNTNPVFTSYEAGVMESGAVFEIKAKKDGWMTVFTKVNTNKQYVVFEGKTGPLPYTLGMANADVQVNYSLPVLTSGDDAGLIDFAAPDASKYFITATKQALNADGVKLWKDAEGNTVAQDTKPEGGSAVMEEIPGNNKPQFPYLVAGLDSKPEDTGFLTFNVIEGNTYYFSALGSKCAGPGFVFTEGDEEPTVTFLATETLPERVFTSKIGMGVESIVATELDENAPIYNAQGIRVNADAKGLLIQNGKKFIRK